MFAMLADLTFFPSATKLRQGNVFTPVSHSVHGGRVSASVHAEIHTPWAELPQKDTPLARHLPLGRQPPWADTPPPADGHCSRRYASYWNAFFLCFSLSFIFLTFQDLNT